MTSVDVARSAPAGTSRDRFERQAPTAPVGITDARVSKLRAGLEESREGFRDHGVSFEEAARVPEYQGSLDGIVSRIVLAEFESRTVLTTQTLKPIKIQMKRHPKLL